MKRIIAAMWIIVLIFSLQCGSAKREIKENENRTQMIGEEKLSNANRVVGKIEYIKDSRTGLCFAYLWDGTCNGGPALTIVPCDSIPSELLTVAN